MRYISYFNHIVAAHRAAQEKFGFQVNHGKVN